MTFQFCNEIPADFSADIFLVPVDFFLDFFGSRQLDHNRFVVFFVYP